MENRTNNTYEEISKINDDVETTEEKPKVKITSVTYGMRVLVKTADFENITSYMEATAEPIEGTTISEAIGCIRESIRDIAKQEYRSIRQKADAFKSNPQQK